MKRTYAVVLAAILLSCGAGCNRQAPDIGSLEVQPRSVSLPYPQLTTLHLTWTPAAASGDADTPSEPLVFLHLLGAKGQVLRTFDHPFPRHWLAGTPVSYDVKLFQSALAPPLDPGKYRLIAGLYGEGGKRWPLGGLGEPVRRGEYLAAEVEVPPQPAGPRLEFSSQDWLPIEAGTDKQVVARRWLSERPGEIRVEAIPGPGTLWLSFRIPAGDGPYQKLVYHDASSNSPAVVVRGTCGAVETGISGPGPHEVEMPIEPPPSEKAEGGCRVTFVPNFHVLSNDHPAPRSVALENAAWISGAHGPSQGGGPSSAGAAATPTAPPNVPGAPPSGATGKPGGGTGA